MTQVEMIYTRDLTDLFCNPRYNLKPAVQPPATNGSRVFRWDMSVTPFKARNESQHWDLRHFQVGYPGSAFTSAEDVHKTGANVINIHQGVDTMINRTHHNGHVVFSSLTADAMSLLLLSIYQLPLHP